MKIVTLSDFNINEIVDCLIEAFQNYFVPMPADISYWENRFNNARVNWDLSAGVVDEDKLVAFIIHAVDSDAGMVTAFNTGTGVIPDYRGQKLVDKMYDFIIPELRKAGVKKAKLEVIDENVKAVRVYERIGMRCTKYLKSYGLNLKSYQANDRAIQVGLDEIEQYANDFYYSWDNTFKTLKIAEKHYQCYVLKDESGNETIGYYVINPEIGYVAQLDSFNKSWDLLFSSIANLCPQIKMVNIDAARYQLISYLEDKEAANVINQFEMEMQL